MTVGRRSLQKDHGALVVVDHGVMAGDFIDELARNAKIAKPHLQPACCIGSCQRRSESTSVGRNENASVVGGSGNRALTSDRGSARGNSPSLLQRISNVVAQQAEQSYPDSCGG